ncbi:hypothetical protein Cch01nite_24920 [Cellulomonas chitinilytica]|uniref:Helix-turn-helix domain-containing protein n=1 Tax=Cellulomonas chitinilytica TaxID=398759 RepID=A0A919P1W9_9CELL|nr:helix-turn-helix domain-containing protein [Cellulomonas chitinilytica]GIG21768.1 hypothetical protein Cch01nite_24920 [Cellulomonas chitinilytica]
MSTTKRTPARPAAAPEEMLTVPLGAAVLGTSPDTVYRMIADGRLPSVRYSPRRIRLRRSDLEAFINASSVAATRAPGA